VDYLIFMKSIIMSVLCILSVFLFSAVAGFSQAVKATVQSVGGDVTFSEPGADKFKKLAQGQTLAPGSKIKSGNGTARISVVPGVAIDVESNSSLVMSEMFFVQYAAGKMRKGTVELQSGTISALIDENLTKEVDFKIKTPQGVAAARGTFYGVSVHEGKMYTFVKKGKVGMSSQSKENETKPLPAVPVNP